MKRDGDGNQFGLRPEKLHADSPPKPLGLYLVANDSLDPDTAIQEHDLNGLSDADPRVAEDSDAPDRQVAGTQFFPLAIFYLYYAAKWEAEIVTSFLVSAFVGGHNLDSSSWQDLQIA